MMNKAKSSRNVLILAALACALIGPGMVDRFDKALAGGPETMVITAEGLVDANADTYKRDKGIMVDDLREDAKRQIIEKAVGVYVESSTLTENYTLVRDKVLSRSKGLIKQVIKESPPWVGNDGFGHMLMKAEVYVAQVQDALMQMSREERVSLIKERGDPRISVAVVIRDAERATDSGPVRSAVAENVLKERIKSFGYRVWSEETADKLKAELAERSAKADQAGAAISAAQHKASDFTIIGEAKFKTLAVTLSASRVTVKKYVLTSWSVKCVDNNSGEEIYFNNKVPKKQSWPDEDAAIEDIGQMIGSEFSKEFFEEHLQRPTQVYQLIVMGLPSYDIGEMLKKEFIGLRSVINVDFRNFDQAGLSLYEVEFGGMRSNFDKFVNDTIVKPLCAKLGCNCFNLASAHGNVVKINYTPAENLRPDVLVAKLEGSPPASVAEASPARLKDLVKSPETQQRVEQMNPQVSASQAKEGIAGPGDAKGITRGF